MNKEFKPQVYDLIFWKIKLEEDFPSIEFIVKCLEDNQNGDYGLTFYQTKSEFCENLQ